MVNRLFNENTMTQDDTNIELRNRLLKYFPKLREEQCSLFEKLSELYVDWNAKINLISRKDIDHLFERHLLHSLGIAKVVTFTPHTKIMDVGTGGGFPGLPLAIMFPDVDFYLVDSIGKKIKVVQAIVEELGLKNVRAAQIRAEEVDETFDFVVSRAVTGLPDFYRWVKDKFKKEQQNAIPNGILYLKGTNIQHELNPFGRRITCYPLSDYFPEEFFATKQVVFLTA